MAKEFCSANVSNNLIIKQMKGRPSYIQQAFCIVNKESINFMLMFNKNFADWYYYLH